MGTVVLHSPWPSHKSGRETHGQTLLTASPPVCLQDVPPQARLALARSAPAKQHCTSSCKRAAAYAIHQTAPRLQVVPPQLRLARRTACQSDATATFLCSLAGPSHLQDVPPQVRLVLALRGLGLYVCAGRFGLAGVVCACGLRRAAAERERSRRPTAAPPSPRLSPAAAVVALAPAGGLRRAEAGEKPPKRAARGGCSPRLSPLQE